LPERLLAIDVGNTQTVFGVFENPIDPKKRELICDWRISTNPERTCDELGLVMLQLFEIQNIESSVDGIAISSSVPHAIGELKNMSSKFFKVEPIILGPGIKTGMPILYDNPKEVGPDRIANAVGAFEILGGPAIVVDLGTATTFDAVSKDGEYLGGAITPGVDISMEALFAHAAALRSVELSQPKRFIGKSTVESLQSGAVYGFSCQVDGMVTLFEQELGECKIIATGGLAPLIVPFCKKVKEIEPMLTLLGLAIIYARNFG
jgi:type III pantothenate kinase